MKAGYPEAKVVLKDFLAYPYSCLLYTSEPEELIGDEKYEGGYYFGRIKFDGRE